MKELDQIAIKFYKDKFHQPRNYFLNLLILLASDLNNRTSTSSFKNLPLDLIVYIVSFSDFEKMRKTQQECQALAREVFLNPKQTVKMASTRGGINVFQRNNNTVPVFTFFKSVQIFSQDFKKLEFDLKNNQKHKNPTLDKLIGKQLTKTSENELNEFAKKYAVSYWNEHSSLYKKSVNKQRLFDGVINSEPYSKPEI